MLNNLLNNYAKKQTQHNSSAKANYYKFNATKAYVTHTVALMQLNMHYAAQAHNNTRCTCTAHFCKCPTAHNLQYAINNAITVAQSKQKYAQTHVNFNLQHALTVLQAYKHAA
jgi:hypothetical protein